MKRTFIHLAGAWYGEANLKPGTRTDDLIDDIIVAVEIEDRTFRLVFEWFSGTGFSCPRLGAFNDEWGIFPYIADLLAFMAQPGNSYMSPERLKAELLKLGFVDETPLTADGLTPSSGAGKTGPFFAALEGSGLKVRNSYGYDLGRSRRLRPGSLFFSLGYVMKIANIRTVSVNELFAGFPQYEELFFRAAHEGDVFEVAFGDAHATLLAPSQFVTQVHNELCDYHVVDAEQVAGVEKRLEELSSLSTPADTVYIDLGS